MNKFKHLIFSYYFIFSFAPLLVAQDCPIEILEVDFPIEVSPGETVTSTIKVENISDARSDDLTLGLYILNVNGPLNVGLTLIGETVSLDLDANATKTIPLTITLPDPLFNRNTLFNGNLNRFTMIIRSPDSSEIFFGNECDTVNLNFSINNPVTDLALNFINVEDCRNSDDVVSTDICLKNLNDNVTVRGPIYVRATPSCGFFNPNLSGFECIAGVPFLVMQQDLLPKDSIIFEKPLKVPSGIFVNYSFSILTSDLINVKDSNPDNNTLIKTFTDIEDCRSNANCSTLQFTSQSNQITVSGLSPSSKIELIGQHTDWQIVPVCEGNCSESQVIADLQAGDYFVKVQLFGQDGTFCYREEQVSVSGEGGTGGAADCNKLVFTGGDGQITVSGLTATYDKVEIIGRNTDWQVISICEGNCSNPQIIPDLLAGDYTVKVNQGGNDGSFCYREESVSVSDGGGSTGGAADCNKLVFTGGDGQITVEGLTATYDKVEIIGRNTNWQVILVCEGNCMDTQIIPDLLAGDYTVKVYQGGNDGSFCYREELVVITTSSANRNGDLDAEKAISLYPNPAKTELWVDWGEFSGQSGTVSIYNMLGQKITQKAYTTGDKPLRFNVSDYQNGLYYLAIEAKGNRSITKRFVVENWK